ncbi:MAG TPA: aspartate--tRNA ligase [Candidatus Xenobia bacterium]|jgi:aspartyl-tRNA synthetase
MSEPMTGLTRSHRCGELRSSHIGQEVTLMGWVHRRRDLGGLIFLDLRDRSGTVQVVFNPKDDPALFKKAETLRNEFVVAIVGPVEKRPEGTANAAIATGEIDVKAGQLRILNAAKPTPINIAEDQTVDEGVRLQYRFLDLRRPSMQQKLILRHKVAKAVRDYFDRQDFLEIETPMLVRSTPEGARDYLVPSRVNPGKFYALPQSPQLFKQILMVSGMDRYFQIARCFRDEDLRADRQPEFTQIDVEMSFVETEDVYRMVEGLVAHVFKTVMQYDIKLPLPRLKYSEAMDLYGSDKPDVRFDMRMHEVGDLLKGSTFAVIEKAIADGGVVKAMAVPGMAGASRKDVDELTAQAKTFGAAGLFTVALTGEGVKSSISKYFEESVLSKVAERAGAKAGDLVLLMAGPRMQVVEPFGKLRLELAKRLKLMKKDDFKWVWVVDFPLFRFNTEEQRLEAEHHPFTSALPEDVHLMESEPLKVRAAAYDIVLNGNELGSGSIRIHQRAMQERLFKAIGLSAEEANQKFGFLMEAFEYGAPPHGGIALGLDRLTALMSGVDSIREVVAFPKNQSGVDPMTGAPVEVSTDQLNILSIGVKQPAVR